MRIRYVMAAVATALSVVAMTSQPASALGVRICTTHEEWAFAPPLQVSPTIGGGATLDYSGTCSAVNVTPVPGPGNQIVSGTVGYSLAGNCVLAVLQDPAASPLGNNGILVAGMVGVRYGATIGTFDTITVDVLNIPSPLCFESTNSGTGVAVGVF